MNYPIHHSVALTTFPVEKLEGEVDRCRAVVFMPVGAEVVGVVKSGVGLAICALVASDMIKRVAHSIFLAPTDVPVTPAVGKGFGAPLGFIIDAHGPITILPELPWPVVG